MMPERSGGPISLVVLCRASQLPLPASRSFFPFTVASGLQWKGGKGRFYCSCGIPRAPGIGASPGWLIGPQLIAEDI